MMAKVHERWFLTINCLLIEINLWSFEPKKIKQPRCLQQLIREHVSELVIELNEKYKGSARKTEILDPTVVMFCLQQPHKIIERENPKSSGNFPNLYLGSWPFLAPRVSLQIPRSSWHFQSGNQPNCFPGAQAPDWQYHPVDLCD